MDDREQQRKVRHRLAVIRHAQEVTGNVAKTCRYYGISRQCFYKWLRRYEELGEEGLRDGSSAPLNCPNATKPEVVSQDRLPAEPLPLRAPQDRHVPRALPRHHDQSLWASGGSSTSSGCPSLPASQRYKRHKDRCKRYEKQLPGQRVQVDVKFIEPIGAGAQEALPVHRDRRLHPDPGAQSLSPLRPEDRHPVPRLPARAAPVQGRGHPNRQRGRVPSILPLAPPRPRDRPRLHPPGHAQTQRQSREIPPDRRRGVLPNA